MNNTVKIICGQKTKNNQHSIGVEQSWKAGMMQLSDLLESYSN